MTVELWYFDGCPNWRIAQQRLHALGQGRGFEVELHRVESAEDAERVGFRGSPTILIDGSDPFGDASLSVGLSCRVYQTPDGPAGAPSLDQLRDALDR